jgi:hypothetical protein
MNGMFCDLFDQEAIQIDLAASPAVLLFCSWLFFAVSLAVNEL